MQGLFQRNALKKTSSLEKKSEKRTLNEIRKGLTFLAKVFTYVCIYACIYVNNLINTHYVHIHMYTPILGKE